MKNTENTLNSILLELFKEKVNEVYKDICDKIDNFDKDIISLNGKPESIKNYLIKNFKINKKIHGKYMKKQFMMKSLNN